MMFFFRMLEGMFLVFLWGFLVLLVVVFFLVLVIFFFLLFLVIFFCCFCCFVCCFCLVCLLFGSVRIWDNYVLVSIIYLLIVFLIVFCFFLFDFLGCFGFGDLVFFLILCLELGLVFEVGGVFLLVELLCFLVEDFVVVVILDDCFFWLCRGDEKGVSYFIDLCWWLGRSLIFFFMCWVSWVGFINVSDVIESNWKGIWGRSFVFWKEIFVGVIEV